MINVFLGSDPAGIDANCKYLDFNLAKNKSLINGWYRFSEYYMLLENTDRLSADQWRFRQVTNNWADNEWKACVMTKLLRMP